MIKTLFIYILNLINLYAAFQSTPTLMSNNFQFSPTWVVITWERLTTVSDHLGNLKGSVAGYFITYQVNQCYYIENHLLVVRMCCSLSL